MNPGLVVKLRPNGPWRIGPDSGARNRVDVIYHSDSLYSAVTSAMSLLGWLDEWLDATARSGAPAVSFGSCFPFMDDINFVVPPRTLWPPASPSTRAERVRWKSARFVPLTVVQSILSGRRLDENQWSVDGPSDCLVPSGRPGPFRTAVRWSAGVDRLTGASDRHSTGCIEFRPGAGLWTVVSFADEAAHARWAEPVKAAFRLLADSGFGGERSRGWGRADAPEFTEGMLPELVLAPVEPAAGAATVRERPAVAPMKSRTGPEGSDTPEPSAASPVSEAVPKPEPEAENASSEATPPEPQAAPESTDSTPRESAPAEATPEPQAAAETTESALSDSAAPEADASQTPQVPAGTTEPAAPESAAASETPALESKPAAEATEPAPAEPSAPETTQPPAPESAAASETAALESKPAAESTEPAPAEPAAPGTAEPAAPESAASETAALESKPAAESTEPAEPSAPGTAEPPAPESAAASETAALESKPAAGATEPAPAVETGDSTALEPVAPEPPALEPAAETSESTPLVAAAPETTESAAPVAEPRPEPASAEPQLVVEISPEPASNTHPHWLLSVFTPAATDAVDWRRGNYTVLARGGRIESPAGSGGLKKQIQMVAEGSVIYAEAALRGSAADVAPDGFAHPVFRAGFALAIPLPEVH